MPGRLGRPSSIETLPFLSWVDDLAWTEDTQSFQKAARKESAQFEAAVLGSIEGHSERLTQTALAFQDAATTHSALAKWTVPLTAPRIWIRPNFEGGGGLTWGWIRKDQPSYRAGDAVYSSEGDCVVYTQDVGKGREDYCVMARTARGLRWTSTVHTGSEVAVEGSLVYVLEQTSPLRMTRLVSLNLQTGVRVATLYEEADPEIQLSLRRGEGGCLFLVGIRPDTQTLFHIHGRRCTRLSPEGVSFIPIGFTTTNQTVAYLVRQRRPDAPWTAVGISWNLRGIEFAGIEFVNAAHGIGITKDYGISELWALGPATPPKRIGSRIGSPHLNLWQVSEAAGYPLKPLELLWFTPGAYLQRCSLTRSGIQCSPLRRYATTEVGSVKSADGAPVRWILLRSLCRKRPTGLLVSAYGAYGLPTLTTSSRWVAWLDAGWAVAFALVRGGGDGSELWTHLGRLSGKEQAINDLESVTRYLQRRTGCGPARTCLFGRSAGGLLLGGAVARHPTGDLATLVYAEVPYVDLLKTASDPDLPLTPYEYREFANPRAGPAEFAEALTLSPVHRIGPDGAPGVRVLCRTGTNDMQVYPYEPLKWIYRLRGGRPGPDGKYFHMSTYGHFPSGMTAHLEWAADLLLLSSWLDKDPN